MKKIILLGILGIFLLVGFLQPVLAWHVFDLRLTNPIFAESEYVSQTNITQMNVLMYNVTNDTLVDFVGFFNASNTTFTFYPIAEINISLINNYEEGVFYTDINSTNIENPIVNVTQWIENNQSWANFTYQWNTTDFIDGIYNFTFFVRNETIQPGFVMGRDSLTLFVNLSRSIQHPEPPIINTTTSPNSGSSSGGSGGNGISYNPEIISNEDFSVSTYWDVIPANMQTFLDSTIEFSTIETVYGAKMSVIVYKEKPPELAYETKGKVYKYFKIDANFNDKLKTAKIKFSISSTWMRDNQFSVDNIWIKHFGEPSTIIKAKWVGDLDFEYETNSFSYFAIVGMISEKTPQTQSQELTQPIIYKEKFTALKIGVVIIIFLIAVFYIFIKNKKIKTHALAAS